MSKILDNETTIKIDGKWLTLKAILVGSVGGQRVVYIDKDGNELHNEPYSRSKYYKKEQK